MLAIIVVLGVFENGIIIIVIIPNHLIISDTLQFTNQLNCYILYYFITNRPTDQQSKQALTNGSSSALGLATRTVPNDLPWLGLGLGI